MSAYRRIAQLKTADDFRLYLQSLGLDLPFEEEVQTGPHAPLAQSYRLKDGFSIGNRFCIQPMEGWDGTPDGKPSALTFRRWRRFGESGAKLVWGGEATAVCLDGRANPNQLLINPDNLPELSRLRLALVDEHAARYGNATDLMVGLQLTHSGRFARSSPQGQVAPVIAYHHPYLDEKVKIPPDYPLITDGEIRELIRQFIAAAAMAQQAGFDFVDIKHCHGYLGHELLSAFTRPGPYGGVLENRARFLCEVINGIHQAVPGLRVGVRLSAFDLLPFEADPLTGRGMPVARKDNRSYWFGCDEHDPLHYDLSETERLLRLLQGLGVELVNLTAGSPYYNPHIQRPALFPPSDGYTPPEDPLVGVARQVHATAALKRQFPGLLIVGSAYSYLQEWLPNVAQYNVRAGWVDFVGLGRMALAYPHMPADILAGKALDRKHICRTFSDCTTAPRKALVSGCYPLDEHYKGLPEANLLAQAKGKSVSRSG